MTELHPTYGPTPAPVRDLDIADQILELTDLLDAYLTRPHADPAVCEMLTLAIDLIDALLAEGKAVAWRH